nr:MAG TPA: hypothetical protein [Caudoviricetes sp.]
MHSPPLPILLEAVWGLVTPPSYTQFFFKS